MIKTIKVHYTPKEWQRDCHNGLQEHYLNSFHIVKSRRQVGKSIMLEMMLLKAACSHSNSVSYSLSPTLEQARKMFDEIKKALKETPLMLKCNDTRLIIDFWNGSTINFKSAEQGENLRGYTVKNGGIMVVDEAAYISDSVFFTCLPWVNVSKSPVIICSTPKFKTGFFYDFYRRAEDGEPGFYRYDWTQYDVSEFLSDEMLELYRRSVPRQKFLTDYIGMFMDLEGNVFGSFDNVIKDKFSNDRTDCVMGIDWGTGSEGDYTAISVFNKNKEMVALKYFNDKDETTTIETIVNLIKEYKPRKCIVEKNSIGSVYFGLLKKAIREESIGYTAIQEFVTTNESKHEIVSLLQVAIQNGDITLINDLELVSEMCQYEVKPSKTGKPTYNAANGYHDDLLLSIMFCLYGLQKGNSSVMFG